MGSDPAVELDWSLGSQAARLADWDAAVRTARSISGSGPKVSHAERAEMREQLTRHVEQAETLVAEFTGITVGGFRSRAWVMGRGDWTRQNLKGLQRAIEPLARRIAEKRPASMSDKTDDGTRHRRRVRWDRVVPRSAVAPPVGAAGRASALRGAAGPGPGTPPGGRADRRHRL